MRPTRRSKVLGIAIGERMALVAEVSSTGGRAVVHHVGEFHYPGGMDLAHPDALGRALGDFLGQMGMASRAAVFGVPGKWVLSMQVQAPPASPELIADTLRLQAEGEFADGGEFAYDYTGETSATEARNVLLMAMPRRHVDQVNAIASAARLKAVAITPFAVTLSAIGGRASKSSRVLLMGPAGVELVTHAAGHAQSLKYLGPASASAAHLAGEIRRAGGGVASSKSIAVGVSGNGANGAELLLWNDARLESGALRAMGESLGGPFRLGEPQALGVVGSSSAHAPAGYATAVSLAIAGLDDVRLPINFLHSRLDVKPQARIQRRTLVIAGAVAAVLLIALWGYSDIYSRKATLADADALLKAQTKQLRDADSAVTRMTFAQGWNDANPTFVQCMNDVTSAIPDDGRAFITNFTMNGELRGQVSGKARTDEDVLALLDKLNSSGRFADVNSSISAAPRPSGAQRKPTGAAPTPPPPQPAPTPQPAPGPTPPSGEQLPGGITSAQMDAFAAAAKSGKPPPPEIIAMVQTLPRDQQKLLEKAMMQRMGAPGGPPPQAAAPQPTPQPVAEAPGPARPPKGEAAAGPAPASEVSFVMTFNYVPRK